MNLWNADDDPPAVAVRPRQRPERAPGAPLRIGNTAKVVPPPALWEDVDDRPVTASAQCRNFCGDFCEDAGATLLGAVRLRTDGRCDYCPDLRVADGAYAESKCVGKTGHAIAYAHRLDRDRQLVEQGLDLYYVVWHHRFKTGDVEWVSDVRAGLARGMRSVTILPFRVLHPFVLSHELKLLNSGYTKGGRRLGYGSNGYGRGYTMLVSRLRELAGPAVVLNRLAVGSHTIRRLDVHCHPDALHLLKKRPSLRRKSLDTVAMPA